jgi:hypothetical protein
VERREKRGKIRRSKSELISNQGYNCEREMPKNMMMTIKMLLWEE